MLVFVPARLHEKTDRVHPEDPADKKQTVDLAAHNCDTFLDSAVTVHPIHVGRGVVTANTLVGVQNQR